MTLYSKNDRCIKGSVKDTLRSVKLSYLLPSVLKLDISTVSISTVKPRKYLAKITKLNENSRSGDEQNDGRGRRDGVLIATWRSVDSRSSEAQEEAAIRGDQGEGFRTLNGGSARKRRRRCRRFVIAVGPSTDHGSRRGRSGP
ncbi:uncharacterized protein LOC143150692 [Ptiloglossa arizonensis]|uniref:uncharacterized protein LOC143150692 n=1 Tax=Ptiloglossa arizonensis TaxID=3350558 RepID=UPI003F9FE321